MGVAVHLIQVYYYQSLKSEGELRQTRLQNEKMRLSNAESSLSVMAASHDPTSRHGRQLEAELKQIQHHRTVIEVQLERIQNQQRTVDQLLQDERRDVQKATQEAYRNPFVNGGQ
jgi:chromosome segregation ATPase